jgi:hypothetical protein
VPLPLDANQVRLGARKVYFNATKAYQELGAPQITMPQSVADTYAWYVAQGYIRPHEWVTRLIRQVGTLIGRKAR